MKYSPISCLYWLIIMIQIVCDCILVLRSEQLSFGLIGISWKMFFIKMTDSCFLLLFFFSCQLKLKSISTYSLYINNPLWSHDKKKLCWISPKSSIQHRLSIQGTWLPEEDYLCMYIDLFLFRNWLEDSSKIVFITCQICRG